MTTATMRTLSITPRAAALTIAADPTLEAPYQVSWKGAKPTVREHDHGVEIGYTISGRLTAMSRRRGTLGVALNPARAWSIELRGGVSGLRADLCALDVSEIVISGAASDLELNLPQPRGMLRLRVAGGLSRGTVRRPAGVPVGVEIAGAATDLHLDGDHLGAVGGAVRRWTGSQASGSGDIALVIEGSASGLTVTALDS